MKKWKIFVTALVLLVAAGAGTVYYFMNVKQYNTKDALVAKIVKSDYQIKLPGNETVSENKNSLAQQSTKETASSNNAHHSSSQTVQISSKGKAASSMATEKLSASAILAKYQPVFKDLENQANGKIDTLLSYAFSEYSLKKAKGEPISYFYFYAKYDAAGKQLEASTDASFNYIYSALLSELKKNGYSASVAVPIKQQYTNMKNSRRTALLKKAITHFS